MYPDYEISGLDGSGINGLLGDLGQLSANNPARKRFGKMMRNKNGIVATKDVTGKAEFEKRLKDLPKPIQDGLLKGKLQLTDECIYSVKAMGGISQKELMEDADVKTVGITNLNNRKLEANKYFLLLAVALVSGVNADPKATVFVAPNANILNGEFELYCGSTVIVPRLSCTIFNTSGRNNIADGYFRITPQWIMPQRDIKPQLFLPTAAAANTNVKLCLYGVSIEKN